MLYNIYIYILLRHQHKTKYVQNLCRNVLYVSTYSTNRIISSELTYVIPPKLFLHRTQKCLQMALPWCYLDLSVSVAIVRLKLRERLVTYGTTHISTAHVTPESSQLTNSFSNQENSSQPQQWIPTYKAPVLYRHIAYRFRGIVRHLYARRSHISKKGKVKLPRNRPGRPRGGADV